MLTAATTRTPSGPTPLVGAATAQTVMIVNGSPATLELLEAVLGAGRYDVVFVESSDHAYSQIKRLLPDLVILCVRIDDMDGFQVLSMLKLDDETSHIPVLTCTVDREPDLRDEEAEPREPELFARRAVEVMN